MVCMIFINCIYYNMINYMIIYMYLRNYFPPGRKLIIKNNKEIKNSQNLNCFDNCLIIVFLSIIIFIFKDKIYQKILRFLFVDKNHFLTYNL